MMVIIWRTIAALSKAQTAFETRILSQECRQPHPDITRIQILIVCVSSFIYPYTEATVPFQKNPIPYSRYISSLMINVTSDSVSGNNASMYQRVASRVLTNL